MQGNGFGERKDKNVRLDKYLSSYAGMTRKEARRAVRSGDVQVEGAVVKSESKQVEINQEILVRGEKTEAEEFVYYMMNKPKGVITATRDTKDKTVMDLMPVMKRDIFPMGRLDKDTEGLLILTDDGALAHRLLSPARHVDKTYEVTYEGQLPDTAVEDFQNGLDIGERRITKPAVLEIKEPGKARVIISEGKFHQVKRMFAAEGVFVTGLKRTVFAGLCLDNRLAPGESRKLTETEIECLRIGEKHG